MLEHRLERTRIAGAQELEEPRRESRSRHVADPPQVQQHPLERRQPAARHRRRSAEPRARHSRRAGCSMSKCGTSSSGSAQAMEHPARLHHRHVERLAVVGDDQIRRRRSNSATAASSARSAREAGEQELAHLERAEHRSSRSRPGTRPCRRRRSDPVVSRSMKTARGPTASPPLAARSPDRGAAAPSQSSSSQSPIWTSPCQRSDS